MMGPQGIPVSLPKAAQEGSFPAPLGMIHFPYFLGADLGSRPTVLGRLSGCLFSRARGLGFRPLAKPLLCERELRLAYLPCEKRC